MAKSENNEVMFGARGQVGNLVVFKNYYGRTIISKVKTKRDKEVFSEKQELTKERFKEAVIYAKGAVKDEILCDFYRPFEKGGCKIYNLAVADFCKPPEVKSIKLTNYDGNIGDYLTIRVLDNFKVVGVAVTVKKPDGSVIESGPAVLAANEADWIYTATVVNEDVGGTIINIKASDTPGNVTEFEQVLTIL
ncbi:MAG: hypothetical protein WC622_16525 [Pedobacter sp.]|jgi:hypothetical protein|uniref:hypothetical protein n=1 Tax=Pedobacter sp. TaxID=1411316 RepID=UPI003563F1E8